MNGKIYEWIDLSVYEQGMSVKKNHTILFLFTTQNNYICLNH